MWGAQARAAEYKAFQAAAARRAMEEHKLPQKPAPVSLSAFTKNAPLNRNKGTKAWKPLVLEDTPEADTDSPENNEGTFSTPTRLRPTDRTMSISEASDRFLLIENERVTRSSDSTPSSTAPTAPRAMLRMPQASSTIVYPTPKRVQSHSIVKQAPQGRAQSVRSSPGRFSGTGGFPNPIPYPCIAYWGYDLHGFPVIVSAPMPTMPTMPMTEPLIFGYPGSFMVPNDISPSKQENKLASLSHDITGPSSGFFTPYNYFTPTPGSLTNEMQPPMPAIHFGGNPGSAYYQEGMLITDPSQRTSFANVNADNVVELDGNLSDSSSFSMPSIVGHHSDSKAPAAPIDQQANTVPIANKDDGKPSLAPVVSSSEDEPYDRKTKMQSFVAAQQALARTGKTVLRNPDLHRVKASDVASPGPSGSIAPTPEHDAPNQKVNAGSHTILKPPPGFGLQPSGLGTQPLPRKTSQADNDQTTSPIDQATLQQIFEVDTEDWLELKPVTKADRTKMSRVMKTFARAQAPDKPREFVQKSGDHNKKELEQWMYLANKDNKPITATRKLFEEAAQEHLSSDPNGLNGNELSEADIECAAICAVGDIVANLTDSAGTSTGTDIDGLFYKYKPAPEYAIERSQLLLGNAGTASFFEENTGGFYTAPSRIARDPRFRPAGKEVIQAKIDENWKLRADMYGRRRI